MANVIATLAVAAALLAGIGGFAQQGDEVLATTPDRVLQAGASADELDETLPCRICDFDFSTYTGPLSEDEVIGLLRALNDEYHAWAVYDQVIADHGEIQPFTNIRRSEQQHIDLLLPLLETYDVEPVPVNPWIGDVPRFEDRTAACAAGVDAEIANVELYDEIESTTDRQDILDVYAKLRTASQDKHLPAFERCADGGGGSGSGGGPGNGGGAGSGGDHGGRRRAMLPIGGK